jgi:hypothetical protein
MHILQNILQDRIIMGTSQVMKSAQFLTPFPVQHTKDTLDTQNGEIVIQSPDSIWHRFQLPDNPVDLLLHFLTYVGGRTAIAL